MNDRCVSLLDNYDVEVLRTTKGRGAILCETNQGMLIFKEYIERRNKIYLQNEVLASTYRFSCGKIPFFQSALSNVALRSIASEFSFGPPTIPIFV